MKTVEQQLNSYVSLLKARAPGASLRATAQRLGVSPSYWSKVLRAERPLSQKLLPKVAKVFQLDGPQISALQKAVLREIENKTLAPATGLKTADTAPTEAYALLGESDHWLLEKWYYIPILNCFTLGGPRDPAMIARRLRLPLAEAEQAVELLRVHGFVHRSANRLERTDRKMRFPTSRSHSSVRRYHQSVAQKAREELSRAGTEEGFSARQISSICFAGSPEKLEEARHILEEALYRAANLMANEPAPSEIYQLNLQLFPLTRK